jgi:uncharacterized protein
VLVPPGSRRVLARRAALGTVAASMTLVGLPTLAHAAPPGTPFISEIHYDNGGTDVGEFVEVDFPSGTTSAGWKVVLYNGNGGAVYDAVSRQPLPSVTGPAVAVIEYPASTGVQNGSPDGLALVRPDGTVAEFLSYEGTFTATEGPANGQTSVDIGVSEAGTEPAGQSLSRRYDPATGTLVWSGPAAATKGTPNGGTTSPPPPPPTTVCDTTPTHEIGAVQGSGATTPVAGRQVTVRGTVVGDVPGFSGFYLQDVDGDGDTATSDGMFVFSPVAVDLGDTVAVTGRAEEFGGQTQITSQRDVAVCADGTAGDLPAPARLDLPADDGTRERLEGMLVVPVDTLTVSEVFDLTSFGELTLSEGGLLVQPTELARPGTPEAAAVAAGNTLRRIVLDDGLSARVSTTTRPYLSPSTPVRVGDELAFTSPLVLGYGFGQWRLQPADGTAAGTFEPQNTRPASPDAVGGDVRLGAFNVLNYFLTLEKDGGRGATTKEQFEKQAGKIVPAIEALGADVVTLMEIEDTDSTGASPGNADGALADLVGRLDAAAGYDKWSYVPLPEELYAVDRDVIRSAIIYQNDVVLPVGDSVGLVDEAVWDNAREPIGQTFVKDGDRFTVVANHFKSKGSAPGPAATTPTSVTVRAPGTVTACGRPSRWPGSPRTCAGPAATPTSSSWVTSTPTPRRTRSRSSARRASPTSAACWTRSATATSSTTCPARSTTRSPRPSSPTRSPVTRTGTSTRSSRSPTSTSATRPCTRPTRTAPATTIPWCWASTSRSAARAGSPRSRARTVRTPSSAPVDRT